MKQEMLNAARSLLTQNMALKTGEELLEVVDGSSFIIGEALC